MAQLAVVSLKGRLYQVTDPDGKPYAVTWGKQPTCDCGVSGCAHRSAVAAFRDAEPLAHVIFPKTQEEVLDLLGPSWEDVKGQPEPTVRAPDADTRAVALAGLAIWEKELATGKRTPTTFDDLWRAACAATEGRDVERLSPRQAAECYARSVLHLRDASQAGSVAA